MCVVSMIADHYWDKTRPYLPQQIPDPLIPKPANNPEDIFNPPVRKQEFEELKRMMEEMKQLLIKAKIYDEENNEPHCEKPELIAALKLIAKSVGVSLEEVFSGQ